MNRRTWNKRSDAFSFSDLADSVGSLVTNKLGIQDELDALKPLRDTMTSALSKAGIQVPTNFNELVNKFSNEIVKKTGAPAGTVTDVLEYVKKQVDTANSNGIQTLSPVNQAVAQGGQNVIDDSKIESLGNSPMLWVIIGGIFLLIIILLVVK